MLKLPRISIGFLMAVVLMLACDLGIVRGSWDKSGQSNALSIICLPVINVLLLSIPWAIRDSPRRHFWRGFQWFGWPITLFVGLATWHDPEAILWPLAALWQPIQLGNDIAQFALEITSAIAIYSSAQILPAWFLARLASRYRVVIVRRLPA